MKNNSYFPSVFHARVFKIAFIFFILLLILKCSSSSGKLMPEQIVHRDTSRILGCFIDFKSKKIFYDVMYMISKDTALFKNVDSNTQKKQWLKDTMFYVPTKSADTLAKNPVYIPVLRESVSIERNFDSALNILQTWVKNHPQYFPSPPVVQIKKDSTAKDTSVIKKNK